MSHSEYTRLLQATAGASAELVGALHAGVHLIVGAGERPVKDHRGQVFEELGPCPDGRSDAALKVEWPHRTVYPTRQKAP